MELGRTWEAVQGEEVRFPMDSDRRRALLSAMLAELGERGYEDASVDVPLRIVGVTRDEFDAEFADKDACLFAAFEAARAEVVRRVKGACGGTSGWPARVQEGLRVLLDAVAKHPATARVMTRAF